MAATPQLIVNAGLDPYSPATEFGSDTSVYYSGISLLAAKPGGIDFLEVSPARRIFVSFHPITHTDLALSESWCEPIPLHHVMGGAPVLFSSAGDTSVIGAPEGVDLYTRYLSPAGLDSLAVGPVRAGEPAPQIDLTFTYCPNRDSAIQSPLGAPDPRLRLIPTFGSDFLAIGDTTAISIQFVAGATAGDQFRPSHRTLAGFPVDIDLTREECPNGSSALWFSFPFVPLQRGVSAGGLDTTLFGDAYLRRSFERLHPVGVDTFLAYNRTLVGRRVLKGYLFSTECQQMLFATSALQHALGEAHSLLPAGVDGFVSGDAGTIQGPPKLLPTGLDALQPGVTSIDASPAQTVNLPGLNALALGTADASLGVPPAQTVSLSGLLALAPGTTDVSLGTQFVTVFNAQDVAEYGPVEVLLGLKPVVPFGLDALDAGQAWISLWRRTLSVDPVGDTSRFGGTWASHSPRSILPSGDSYEEIPQVQIWERLYGGVQDDHYGAAEVKNLNQFVYVPAGNTWTELTHFHSVQWLTRRVYPQPLDASELSGPIVYNLAQYVSPRFGQPLTGYPLYTLVINRNRPVFAYGEPMTRYADQWLVGRNPNQLLTVGGDLSRFGAQTIANRNRRIYVQPFNWNATYAPDLKVIRQIVFKPDGVFAFAPGLATVELPDIAAPMEGSRLSEYGNSLIAYRVREVHQVGINLHTEIGSQTRAYLNPQYVTPDGVWSFRGPFPLYVDERFSILKPGPVPPKEDNLPLFIGSAFLYNRNREVTPRSVGSSGYFESGFHAIDHWVRRLEVTGLNGSLGDASVRDSRQWVSPDGTDCTEVFWHRIYLGDPNLPVPQRIRFRGVFEDLPGVSPTTIWHYIREIHPEGVDAGSRGTAEVVTHGAGVSTLGVLTGYGRAQVFGGGSQVSLAGRDFLGVGHPSMSPHWVYATYDLPGGENPYPGTHSWYPPDYLNRSPYDWWVRIGEPWVSNFIREVRVDRGFYDDQYSHVTYCTRFGRNTRVHFPETDNRQYVTPVGESMTKFTVPRLLGGLWTIDFEYFSPDTPDFGSAHIGQPIELDSHVYPSGVGAAQFGPTRAELFIRNIYPPSTVNQEDFGWPWVSRSPRYLEATGDTFDGLGSGSWISYYVRYLSPEGIDTSKVRGFSPEAFEERTMIYHSPWQSTPKLGASAGATCEFGLVLVERGSICG